jgi:hypothetical protein
MHVRAKFLKHAFVSQNLLHRLHQSCLVVLFALARDLLLTHTFLVCQGFPKNFAASLYLYLLAYKQFYCKILDAILMCLSNQFHSSRYDVSLLPSEQTPKRVYCTFRITLP